MFVNVRTWLGIRQLAVSGAPASPTAQVLVGCENGGVVKPPARWTSKIVCVLQPQWKPGHEGRRRERYKSYRPCRMIAAVPGPQHKASPPQRRLFPSLSQRPKSHQGYLVRHWLIQPRRRSIGLRDRPVDKHLQLERHEVPCPVDQ